VQEEYLAEESLDEKKGLKNMCKKGFWVKNLWVKKKILENIGIDGMLIFVLPFSNKLR
jgi:hypothetical protein